MEGAKEEYSRCKVDVSQSAKAFNDRLAQYRAVKYNRGVISSNLSSLNADVESLALSLEAFTIGTCNDKETRDAEGRVEKKIGKLKEQKGTLERHLDSVTRVLLNIKSDLKRLRAIYNASKSRCTRAKKAIKLTAVAKRSVFSEAKNPEDVLSHTLR